MVGLSVVLEPSRVIGKPSVVNRTAHYSFLQTPPPFPSLHSCCLCHQILLPGKDIYMYKGDRGFCSVECRCRQIIMDEQESPITNESHSPTKTPSFSIPEYGSSSSSMAASRNRKSKRNGRGEYVR